MRYRLRTLLILLAVLPPLLWFGWTKYEAWRAEQELQRALQTQSDLIKYVGDVLLNGPQPPYPPKSPPLYVVPIGDPPADLPIAPPRKSPPPPRQPNGE